MNIKHFLKSNKLLNRFGQYLNIKRQFRQDTRDFCKYYNGSALEKQDYRYRIMLLVHSLEKGMCFPNPRPFGFDKVHELISLLKQTTDSQQEKFEYNLGVSVIKAWVNFFSANGWENENGYKEAVAFLDKRPSNLNVDAGSKEYNPIVSSSAIEVYDKFFLSRHSVRNYQKKKIDFQDIQFALKCFVETPTACNRQMCRVYYIEDNSVADLLKEVIVGIPGFDKDTVQFFVITYDLSAFAYSGERQQGMFNAGLCTMNFINGLHANGIGSCCLQWSNKKKQDIVVRNKLGLRDSERIGIVIGAGYYLDSNIIPCSIRRDINDVFMSI